MNFDRDYDMRNETQHDGEFTLGPVHMQVNCYHKHFRSEPTRWLDGYFLLHILIKERWLVFCPVYNKMLMHLLAGVAPTTTTYGTDGSVRGLASSFRRKTQGARHYSI